MRVLSVVNWLNRGGIEVQLLQAVPWLKRHGVESDVCCMGRGVLDGDFAAEGCAIRRISKRFNCYRTARDFQQVLAQGRYDVVHSHLGHTSGGIVLGAARMGIPAAVSFHSSAPLSLAPWRSVPGLRRLRACWLQWHRRLITRYAQALVGHSEANLRALGPPWGAEPEKCRVLLNGTAFPAALPTRSTARRRLRLDDRTLVLLHVGSLKREKNHEGLLEILAKVVQRRPATVLALVGDGPLRCRIAAAAERMNLVGHVRFEGEQADPWPYYSAADVFVFPSISEGFGNALVECQAGRLPLVASDLPAHHESVAPAQHRFLFSLPRYDRAAELVLAQAGAAQRSENPWVISAQEHVRTRFPIERFAADLKKLYLDLAQRR